MGHDRLDLRWEGFGEVDRLLGDGCGMGVVKDLSVLRKVSVRRVDGTEAQRHSAG